MLGRLALPRPSGRRTLVSISIFLPTMMNLLAAFGLAVWMSFSSVTHAAASPKASKVDTSADSIVQVPLTRKERTEFERYHQRVRAKIEACANQGNLQQESTEAQGTVFIAYAISGQGQLENIGIRTPSGNPELDERMVHIMKSCGPVDQFPKALAQKVDRMAMISGMTFASQPERARLRIVNRP